MSVCRLGFAQTCCVCSQKRWRCSSWSFNSPLERKVFVPGCGLIREMAAESCWAVWGPNGPKVDCDFQQQVGGQLADRVANRAGGGGGNPTHFVDYQMTHPAWTMPTCVATPPFAVHVSHRGLWHLSHKFCTPRWIMWQIWDTQNWQQTVFCSYSCQILKPRYGAGHFELRIHLISFSYVIIKLLFFYFGVLLAQKKQFETSSWNCYHNFLSFCRPNN